MKHQKSIFILLLLMIAVFALSACGGAPSDGSDDSGDGAPSGSADSMQSITIYTGTVSGSWYPIGGAISSLVNPTIEQFGYRAGAVPGGGTSNVVAVGNEEGEIGLSYSTNLAVAEKGEYPYEGTPFDNLYAIANMYDMAQHICVAADSGITSLDDLFATDNVKFLPDAKTSGSYWIFELIAAEYGYTLADLEKRGWTFDVGGQSFQSSQYGDNHDMAFTVHTNVPNATTYEMCTSRKTVFLEIPENVRAALVEKWGMKEVAIPANTYPDQTQDILTVTMPCILFCNDSLPDDVVYEITKALCENKEYLVSVHSSFENFNPDSASKDVGIELHPGAKKYYEEAGLL